MILENCYTSFINLDSRPDRLARMENELRKVGIPGIRQRGFLPSEVKVDPSKVRVMQNRTPGAIGCHFSQVEVMRKALEVKAHAFVMEDDLVFCSDFHERMAIVDDFLEDKEWDVIWLGATFHVNPSEWHKKGHGPDLQQCKCSKRKDVETTSNPRILKTYGIWSTYAYIVNVKSIDKILKLLDDHVHESMGIDWLFIRLMPQLNCYCFVPGMVKQYNNKSNIGNGITEFSGFAKLGPYWWADNMKEFDPTTYNWAEANG
jgi:GR25 family glycosyltransferase involved in LPS biosynthesis